MAYNHLNYCYAAVSLEDSVLDIVRKLTVSSPDFSSRYYTLHRPSCRFGSLALHEKLATLNIGQRSVFYARLQVPGGVQDPGSGIRWPIKYMLPA
jgi:hypothetical protein